MDYMLNREALAAGEVLYDGSQEQPVDLDISLPDYCPDIQRILKCQVYPRITGRNIIGDRVELEGTYNVKVFYLDAGGTTLRCCENSSSFFAAITLKQPAESAHIFSFTRVEYINCRATSPRRLDIHGAFSVCAKVIARTDSEVVCGIEGDEIEQKRQTMPYSRLAGFCGQQFPLEEVLELPASKPGADNILRATAFASLQDSKAVAGKLMVKGEVTLKILYSSVLDESMLETMEYAIPFSQMLDGGEFTDDCLCEVKLDIAGLTIQVKNDYSGDKTFFDVQASLYAEAVAYQPAEVTVVTDAYSKAYELEIGYQQKTLEQVVELLNDSTIQKSSISLEGTGISKVFDIWNELSSVTAAEQDGQIVYKGKFNVCILAANQENRPFYTERMVDFEYAHPWGAEKPKEVKCISWLNVAGISYRITGDGIEIKAELRLEAQVITQNSMKIISEIRADEDRPRARDTSAALSIYYADPGESLWDIARAYCTSVDAIRQENNLTGEFVESRGMLLIPM